MQTVIHRDFIYLPIYTKEGTDAWFVPELFIVQESVQQLLKRAKDKSSRDILSQHLMRCKIMLETGIVEHLEDFDNKIKPLYEAISHAGLYLPPPVSHDKAKAWYPELKPTLRKFHVIVSNFSPGPFERAGVYFDMISGFFSFILTIWITINTISTLTNVGFLLLGLYCARTIFSWVDNLAPVKGRFTAYGNGFDRWLSRIYHYPHKMTIGYLISHALTLFIVIFNALPLLFANMSSLKKLVGLDYFKPIAELLVDWFVFLAASVSLTKYYSDIHSFILKGLAKLSLSTYTLDERYENTILTKPLKEGHLTAQIRPYLPFMVNKQGIIPICEQPKKNRSMKPVAL